jgi:hypothetical protein
MISTYTKDFSWKKKDPKWPDFDFFSKSPDFYDKFQYVAKNIERLLFFILSYLVHSQIILKRKFMYRL